MALTRRVIEAGVDPVVAAAVSSFAFVFIHPFEDGNGRIHRFLIHHVLAKGSYGPAKVVFPVSAAILRDRRGYDEVLAGFSEPLLNLIQWRWAGGSVDSPGREMVVKNETADLYRYFDATAFAEYLYDRLAASIRRDLKEELDFVAVVRPGFRRGSRDCEHARSSRLPACAPLHARRGKARREEATTLRRAE